MNLKVNKIMLLIFALVSLQSFTLQSSQPPQPSDASFDKMLQCHVRADAPGVAVRIEQQGRLIYSGSLGMSDVQQKRALTTDDLFQIGSITKQFTAAAVLRLVEQGKLKLSDPLRVYIDDLPEQYTSVTVQQLLSHTAGLADYLNNPHTVSLWHQPAALDHIIRQITLDTPKHPPGEAFGYSNTGYLLLGKVTEVVSGTTYGDFLSEQFFRPLKMTQSTVLPAALPQNAATGYSGKPGGAGQYLPPLLVDRHWIYSAGAIVSTLSDMSRWHRALISGRVVSAGSYQLMVTKARLTSGKTVNYGLGFDLYPIAGRAAYSHQGSVPGFMSWAVYFPAEDLYAVAFSNNDQFHPGPVLLDLIAMQLQLSPPVLQEPIPAQVAQKFIGQYRVSANEINTISYTKGALFSSINNGEKRRLQWRQQDSLSYECTENYFQLTEVAGKTALMPINLYRGAGEPQIKIAP